MNSTISEIKNVRSLWIDFAKYIAIIAVVTDHTYGFLYENQTIAYASFFSVSLFILLSGLSSAITSNDRLKGFDYQFKKVFKLFMNYSLATLVLFVYYRRYFDLRQYFDNLLNFNIQNQFYFLVFFFQLMLVSPILVYWYKFCKKRKFQLIWHAFTLILFLLLSSMFIRHTLILPVYGGGKFLLGGTYFSIYYIGILMSPINGNDLFKKYKVPALVVFSSIWVAWLFMFTKGMINIDAIMSPFFGDGFNPPSFILSIYAVLTLLVLYSLFNVLESLNIRFVQTILVTMSKLGEYTLYIFMYHLLIRDLILSVLPEITNMFIIRVLVFVPMITFPALFMIIYERLKLFSFRSVS